MSDMTGKRGGRGKSAKRWFFTTTAGKVLQLLCRERRTVADLAHRLGLTNNAVRAQLQRLQRDGLVRQAGSRKGVRKPHADYELSEKAYRLFPTIYEPVLGKLAAVLAEKLPGTTVRDLFLETGQRLVREYFGHLPAALDPRQRVGEMMRALNGASAGIDLAQHAGSAVLRTCSCPLASVTSEHPEICDLVAYLLSDALGTTVHEKCAKGDLPQCCFEIALKRSNLPRRQRR
jgi:predicted ArsR family transcriptional regulator